MQIVLAALPVLFIAFYTSKKFLEARENPWSEVDLDRTCILPFQFPCSFSVDTPTLVIMGFACPFPSYTSKVWQDILCNSSISEQTHGSTVLRFIKLSLVAAQFRKTNPTEGGLHIQHIQLRNKEDALLLLSRSQKEVTMYLQEEHDREVRSLLILQ